MDKSAPIGSFDDLLTPFHEGCKGSHDVQLLGTESEKFGVRSGTTNPVQYEGSCGIVGFFEALLETGSWEAKRERDGGPIIALERKVGIGSEQISLEPGAQLELSGAPLSDVHAVAAEIDAHLEAISSVSEACGVRWLSAGYHPLATLDQLPWVPKERYVIMREYFPKVGTRGLDMMRRTATVQVNVDYADEADAVRKLRIASKLSPIATAMCANSPFAEGKLTGGRTERGLVWTDTDKHRCGLLPQMMEPGATFKTYAEWALDVPMYMFKRDGEVFANTGQPFRSFWQDGYDGHKPTMGDWVTHLNTLFPEVRLQKTIELRSTDAQNRALLKAVPALWAGIIYDDAALQGCDELVAGLSHDVLEAARPDIAKRGLEAKIGDVPVRALAEKIVGLASEGLRRRNKIGEDGADECRYLEPLVALVQAGKTPADVLLEGLNANDPQLAEKILERTTI